MSRRISPVAAARRYAELGWPVFPCRYDSKEPATEHGFKDATTDPERIDWWWTRRDPESNVAIATGAPGPDVVDVDVKDTGSGFKGWNEASRSGLVSNPKAIIRTPSGGLHAYFAGSQQGNGKSARAHMDFRGRGGYVVAPGSTVGGRPYVVVQSQAGPGGPVSWQAIRDLVDPQPERKAFEHPAGRPTSLDHLARYVAELPEGNRNDGTFWALCRAAEAGDQAATAAIAESARSVGLTEREITASIRSAERTAARSPEPRPFTPAPQRQQQLEAGS